MNSKNPKICVATATTENFVQWTMVMIHSFLKTNLWFNGDIIVFHRDLPDEMQSDLKLFKNVKLVRLSAVLLQQLDSLCAELPSFTKIIARFYSFEAFNLKDYDKVLFLDSDMIFLKSIEEIFHFEKKLYACVESCWYAGQGRKISTYEKIISNVNDPDFISNPVNSGFILIDKELLTTNHFERLIEMTVPELWKSKNTFHADQLVINVYFKDMITLLDARYNFRPKDAKAVKEIEKVEFKDVKVIHYFRWFKPWIFNEVLKSAVTEPLWITAYDLWYKCYIDFLMFYHLQKKLSSFKRTENAIS
jgi:lipopolysaccharide biosynthesis glycosyltransferase